ncbi:UPF0147 family protein [Candidatus Woesearchaeota archaeon]|nr:UPF0147 family protein [Candidatus Woesearchaeota archaeon]
MTMQDQRIQSIIESMQEIANDSTVPRNVKEKLQLIVKVLQNEAEDILLRKDKALSELDEIAEDTNLQAYTRTQIWNMVSVLEMI